MSTHTPKTYNLDSLKNLLDEYHSDDEDTSLPPVLDDNNTSISPKSLSQELGELENMLKEEEFPTLKASIPSAKILQDEIPTLKNIPTPDINPDTDFVPNVNPKYNSDWQIQKQQLLQSYELTLKTALRKTQQILLEEYANQLDQLEKTIK